MAPVLWVSFTMLVLYNLTLTWASNKTYVKYNFPNPKKDFAGCGQASFSYVCDPENFLSPSEVLQLNSIIYSMTEITTCVCEKSSDCKDTPGHEVMVAVVPRTSSSSYSYDGQLAAVQLFAGYLLSITWRSSDSPCKMRAVIVLDITSKIVWTATNDFAGKVITKDRARDVGRDARDKYFKDSKYFLGLKAMLDQYRDFLAEGPPTNRDWWKILVGVLGGLFALSLVGYLCCSFWAIIMRRPGGGDS